MDINPINPAVTGKIGQIVENFEQKSGVGFKETVNKFIGDDVTNGAKRIVEDIVGG